MNLIPPRLLLKTRDDLIERLTAAQKSGRGKRSDWVEHERQAMLDGVNEERVRMGKPPVEVSEIERVEILALGSDYSEKLALYCAELVYS
jgi:hypothetical protein